MKRFWLGLILCLALGACSTPSHYAGNLVKQYGGEKTRPDQKAIRYIMLYHPDSKETVNVTYFKNGDYQADALKKIDHLFRDRHKNEVKKIDPELIDFLIDIRSRLGLPPSVVFEILSGYRSPSTNSYLKQSNKQTAKNSLHMLGFAVDFRISGVNGSAIAEIAKTMQRGGVSYYPASNHVHVDIGNIRSWKPK